MSRTITQSWRVHANCRGEDPDLFTPPDGLRGKILEEMFSVAKDICAGCPVKASCLADALQAGDRWSVRGGTTPDDRHARRIRRKS